MTSRSSLYTLITNLSERDLISLDFKTFAPLDSILSMTVEDMFIGRPDLISYSVYGTVDYWWLLMMVNGIEDIWNDLVPGLVLAVLSPRDMKRLQTHLIKTASTSEN